MLKKTILSTTLVISSILLTACDSNSDYFSEVSHQITAVSVLGTSNEDTTAIANGGTDSNASATDFEILLPLDNAVLSADPGDGSTVSDMINIQVTNDIGTVKTVNIGIVINPS